MPLISSSWTLHARIVVFAIAAVALTAVGAEATSVSFDETFYFNDATALGSNVGANNAIRIQISSADPLFDVAVSAIEVSQDQFHLEAGDFAGANCLPFLSDGNCLEYVVTPNNLGFVPPISITIAWLLDTNPITMSPFVIQAEGGDPFSSMLGNQHYFPNSTGGIKFCEGDDDHHEECDDPADSGTTDNFSRFAVAYDSTPVPEPTSLMLLGSGVIGLVWRRHHHRSMRTLKGCSPTSQPHDESR